MTDTRRLVLIDVYALAYRAHFSMQSTQMSTPTGEPTYAIYGFTNMVLAIWKEYSPDYFAWTFDLGDTFRHKMYADYKATREKIPEELVSQIERIKQLGKAFNMPMFELENYEADDLLGTLAKQAAAQTIETLIVTGDRDIFQLIDPHINVVISGKSFAERVTYDMARFQTEYGITPTQLVDWKGLVGDSSDNIPGVKGIGQKTATKLLQNHHTLEGVFDNLDSLTKNERAKLEGSREVAFLSRDLSRIETNIPNVTLDLDACKTREFNLADVANLFVTLGFNSIFNRIPGVPEDKSPQDFATVDAPQPEKITAPDGEYITIDTEAKLTDLIARLQASDRLAVDVETDSVNEVETNLVGIAITPTTGAGYYIPVGHGQPATSASQQASMFDAVDAAAEVGPQLDIATVRDALAPILADAAITKYMHNAKFDMIVLQRHGMPVESPIFDTMIAAWVGDNSPNARYGLKDLTLEKLNIQMTEITALIGSGKKQITMDKVDITTVTPYAAADVDMTLRLADTVTAPLHADDDALWRILQELELPLIYVLKDMELTGIKLDSDALREMSKAMAEQLHALETDIHQLAEKPFNINSTQQLSDVLFNQLKLPTTGLRKTKSGHYSTAANVLEGLRGQHEIIDQILNHRSLSKLKSTYVDALPELVNPQTGRIHTSYNQIGISTGRLSSSNPNLQNIPIRTEQGREIRRAFVAEPGHQLIAADYSQVELRILAHITNDPGLMHAFTNDEDIHASTAAAVLDIPIEQVDKYQRRIAKAVNFGLMYGQTAFGLAQGTGMSRDEASKFIKTYFEKYPAIKGYLDETKQMALDKGYVETLLGRRRLFPGLADMSGNQRAATEREIINMPIQGTAADIMKIAMINLHRRLREDHPTARMLLQVHDELVIEAPDAEVEAVAALTLDTMQNAFTLDVPLKVEVEVGQNWLEMETVE